MQVARAGADASSKALSLEEYDTSRWAAIVRGVAELSAVCNGPASSEGLPVAEMSVVPAAEVCNGPASSQSCDMEEAGRDAGDGKRGVGAGESGDWKIVDDVDQGGQGGVVQDEEEDEEEEEEEEEGGKEDEEWGIDRDEEWGIDRFVIKPENGDEGGEEYEDGCNAGDDWFVRFRFEVSPYTGRLHVLHIDGDAKTLTSFLSISPHVHRAPDANISTLPHLSQRTHACGLGHLKLYLCDA
jgi:hypothetical protein